MDLDALAAPIDSEKLNETTFKGDAWIRQISKPLLTQKSQQKLGRSRLRNHHRKTLQK
jgi:hypothetical protein